MNKYVLQVVLKTTRPSFLVLGPVCVLLGISATSGSVPGVDRVLALLILLGAVAAHISMNTLNEYLDFKSGLDLDTLRTPFSGGSGALPAYPAAANLVLIVAVLSLVATIGIGSYLVLERGSQLLPFGLAGVALIILYTKWLNRQPLLCLVAPGLGFGILMVNGTHVAITGLHAEVAWLASMVTFFMVNNLLLLNQYPDRDADAAAGRRTFPIVYGINKSNIAYAMSATAAYAIILYGIIHGDFPGVSAFALVPALLSLYSLHGAVRYSGTIGKHPQYLGANVAATVFTPLLLAITIAYG